MGRLEARRTPRDDDRRLLALALGRRLEQAQQRLDDAQAALRHLGHCPAAERDQWLQRAQVDVDDVRRIIT